MTADKGYYTTIETAELLGVSVRTVQLWVENGSLEAWKTAGGHRRIRTESVTSKLREQDPNYAPSHPDQDKNVSKKRVLVVEDNPTVSLFYKAAIESWGLDIVVDTANDGFQGLVKIGQSSPDVLITDIYMPGMDGLQMIQSLYKSNLMAGEQMIVISGLDDESIQERGGIPSDVLFYRKPIDVEALKSSLLQILHLNTNW